MQTLNEQEDEECESGSWMGPAGAWQVPQWYCWHYIIFEGRMRDPWPESKFM